MLGFWRIATSGKVRVTNMTESEKERLRGVADWYQTEGFYAKLLEQGYDKIKSHFSGKDCLELGCADGAMTEHLVDDFEAVVAIDGADEYCKEVKNRLSSDNLTVVCSLFEEYKPDQQYDTIILAHVLEHVKNPVTLLERAGTWLRDGGRIIIIVPNGNSLHRQVGSKMGLIDTPDTIDEHDAALGHRRVYTPSELDRHVRRSGLRINDSGGIGLKPLTNDQIDQYLDEKIQEAYLQMGNEYPKIAAERYVIAHPPNPSCDAV